MLVMWYLVRLLVPCPTETASYCKMSLVRQMTASYCKILMYASYGVLTIYFRSHMVDTPYASDVALYL